MQGITLKVPRMLAAFCDGQTRLAVSGTDVRSALEDAMARHHMLRIHVLNERGEVREHVHLFLNETDVREDLSAATREGDEIYVLQAMSGGSPGAAPTCLVTTPVSRPVRGRLPGSRRAPRAPGARAGCARRPTKASGAARSLR